MDNLIRKVIEQKVESLRSAFKANDSVRHQGLKGSLNEILLLELISSVIPKRFELTNGVVQDCNGLQSNESDIVIYDNDILPSLIFGSGLGIVPVESVRYVFEVKSTLNATELKSSIEKFRKLSSLQGFSGVAVLFAYASDAKRKSELKRYYDLDCEAFFRNPLIDVILVDGKGYYFHSEERIFLKDQLSKGEYVKAVAGQGEVRLESEGREITVNSVGELKINGDLVVNGHNFEDIFVSLFRWYGVESREGDSQNMLAFLSGVSNTLSANALGKYVLAGLDDRLLIYAECAIDMWGNKSHERIDFNGFTKSSSSRFSYSVSMTEGGKCSQMLLSPK